MKLFWKRTDLRPTDLAVGGSNLTVLYAVICNKNISESFAMTFLTMRVKITVCMFDE